MEIKGGWSLVLGLGVNLGNQSIEGYIKVTDWKSVDLKICCGKSELMMQKKRQAYANKKYISVKVVLQER